MTFMRTPLLRLAMYKTLRSACEDVVDAAEEVQTAYHNIHEDDSCDLELLEQNLADLQDAAVRARDEAATVISRIASVKIYLTKSQKRSVGWCYECGSWECKANHERSA